MKILYIEDDPVDIIAFDRFISCEQMDCICLKATSVQEALKMITEHDFNAVITDYRLGDGNAFDILNACKKCPVIVITGAGNEEIAINAIKLGAYDYLVKDFDRYYLKALPIIVQNAIKRWAAEKLNRLLSHAVKSAMDGICISDLNDTILFVNQSFCSLHDFLEADLLNKKGSIVCLDVEEHNNILHMLTSRADINYTGESIHVTKNARQIPVYLSSSLVQDATGTPMALVTICRDITELRTSDSDLQAMIDTRAVTYPDELNQSRRICIGCRSVQDQQGNWVQLEDLVRRLLGAELSYEICPDCRSRLS